MCEECLQFPCHPRCPNAPDPPAVFECFGCGRDICDGEDFWNILGEHFCEQCIDNAKGVAEYDPY